MSLEKFVVVRCSERLNMPRRTAAYCTVLYWAALRCNALHCTIAQSEYGVRERSSRGRSRPEISY